MATRKKIPTKEFKTMEAQERDKKAEHAELDKQAKLDNKVIEEWYEIRPGRKPGDKKVLKLTRMSNGSKYRRMLFNVKILNSGKRKGYEELKRLELSAENGEIDLRQVVA